MNKRASSPTLKLSISIVVSVIFIYLTIFRPHLGELFSGKAGLLAALFGDPRFNISELGSVLRSARWKQIGITGLIFVSTLFIRAWRWQLILRPLVRMPFWQVFGAMNIGYMANNVLPFRLGEVYRAQVVYQLSGLSRTEAFGTIVAERLVDLVFMVPFIGLTLLLYPLPTNLHHAGLIASAAAFALAGFCVWLGVDHDRAMSWTGKGLRIFSKKTADRTLSAISRFTAGLGVLGKRELFWALTVSSLYMWVAYGLMTYLVLDSLGLVEETPLIRQDVIGSVLVILFVTTFGFVMPGAPGAVGTYHGVTVLGLSLFGVPGDRAVGFALMLHALNWLPLTLLGWAFFWKYGLKFKKPSELGAGMDGTQAANSVS